MIRLRYSFICIVLFAALVIPHPARADYAAAEKAAASGDYATALQALEPLRKGTDSRVFRLLGELNRDGKGTPVDLVEAYVDFSLFGMYTDDPDERATAFAFRRQVARRMPDRVAGIEDGQRRVVSQVASTLGEDEMKRQVHATHKELLACSRECDEIAFRVFRLGPAAADVAPDLEALLTRDVMWMPRETYAYALAYIGTAGVPALAHVFVNEKEMAAEGFWNAGLASNALHAMGPTAFLALPVLADAIGRSYEGLGGEELDIAKDLSGQGQSEMIFQIKVGIAQALVSIGDPGREIHDQLMQQVAHEKDVSTGLLLGWAVGLIYREPDKALTLVESNISADNAKVLQMCLVIIGDFQNIEAAQQRIRMLLPKVRLIAKSGSENLRPLAENVLSLYAD